MHDDKNDENWTIQLMLSFVCFMSKWRFFEFHYLKIKIMMMDCFYLFTVAFLDSRKLVMVLYHLMITIYGLTAQLGLSVRESDFLSKLRYRSKINLNLALVSLDFDILWFDWYVPFHHWIVKHLWIKILTPLSKRIQ